MHSRALLDACTDLVKQTLAFTHPADATVARYFREHRALGPRERAVLTDAVYRVLRFKLLFEHLARSGSGPQHRRLALLGLMSGDQNLPDWQAGALLPEEKTWLEQCATLAPHDDLWRSGMDAPLCHNVPDWLAQALLCDDKNGCFGALARSLLQPAPLDVRVNTLKAKRGDVLAEFAQAGIAAALTPYSPWGVRLAGKPALQRLDAFVRGAIEVQDEGAQLLALLLGARRGEMVVDFCAGAGGKTLALGAAMRNTGRLYALDTSAHRLQNLKPRLERSGLTHVHAMVIAHERDARLERLEGKVDRVLVDAPCSGLGTLRRNPDLKWRQTPATVREYATRQAAILDAAARLLKPGGRLVYATCSLLPAENEEVAQGFTAAHAADFVAQDAVVLLMQEGKMSLLAQHGHGVQGDTGDGFLRLWPHVHQTDGFFAAVWTRMAVQ